MLKPQIWLDERLNGSNLNLNGFRTGYTDNNFVKSESGKFLNSGLSINSVASKEETNRTDKGLSA